MPGGRLSPHEFSELLRPHLTSLYRLAFRMTGRVCDAEDLLQELLTRLYSRGNRLDQVESLRPWLAKALHHLYIDERRRGMRTALGRAQAANDESTEAALRSAQAPFPLSPEQSAETVLLQRYLEEALEELPNEQRMVVIFHDVEGYPLQETAEILGVSLGTVKSRLHRAHERLRERLRKRNFFPANVVLGSEPAVSVMELSGPDGVGHEL